MKNNVTESFRSDVAYGIKNGKEGIDREKGIIYNYAVISKGEAKGHGMDIDDIALDQIIKLGNKSKLGAKSRFGHPNMSTTALGTFLGRAQKFWKDGDTVRANLRLDETAYATPNGDLATYVLDLAESDPAAFGTSIVFEGKSEYRLNPDGTEQRDKKGEVLNPLVRFTQLKASDVVDSPAANEGLFGENFFTDSVKLSSEATAILDKVLQSPDAVDFVIKFLGRYQTNDKGYNCQCVECGYQETYKDHCNEHKCPECGGQMRRVERPGPGQKSEPQGAGLTGKEKKEGRDVELKDLTVAMLKEQRADLTEALLQEGEGLGTGRERERVLAISKEATAFEGMGELEKESIEKGDSVEAASGKFKDKRLKELESGAPQNPGPNGMDNDGAGGGEKLTHLEKATAFQKENGGTLTEALRATAEPRK